MNHADDPFVWLETLDSPEVLAWVAQHNAQASLRLDQDPRFAPLQATILDHLRDTRQIPFCSQHGDWLYNFHQSAELT